MLDLLSFLHQLSGDNLKNLVHSGVVSGGDLMASVHPSPTDTFIIAQVFCGICNASLEWNLSFRRVCIDKVGLCSDNMNDDIVVYVFLKFEKPLDRSTVRGGGESDGFNDRLP
jgi:hypothetical protein